MKRAKLAQASMRMEINFILIKTGILRTEKAAFVLDATLPAHHVYRSKVGWGSGAILRIFIQERSREFT